MINDSLKVWKPNADMGEAGKETVQRLRGFEKG